MEEADGIRGKRKGAKGEEKGKRKKSSRVGLTKRGE